MTHRVHILGGGMAGLTCAYHLSSTPALRARYHVTVHQMGWRLGGKLASGRSPARAHRNEEHGLHVWFGFYDNAFSLVRQVLERWRPPPDAPFRTVAELFRPHSTTQVATRLSGETDWLPIDWPTYEGDEPGDGELERPAWGSVAILLSLFQRALERLCGSCGLGIQASTFGVLHQAVELARKQPRPGPLKARAIHALLVRVDALLRARAASLPHDQVDRSTLVAMLDVGLAFFTGLLNPRYGVTTDWNLDRLNHMDFREWLVGNGGDPTIVANWSVIRALYDTTFQYEDGDRDRPNFAAGTAARIVLRIATQYQGAVLYHVNSGMGEAVISPLYQVLRDQGVDFRFFHRVVGLGLSPDGHSVDRVDVEVQAQVPDDFDPTYVHQGMVCWPSASPVDVPGDAERQLEPPWGRIRSLHRGPHFDTVVLALPLGVLQQTDVARELREQDPAFDAMVRAPYLTPTAAMQLWMDAPTDALGWDATAALVGWKHPLPIWADMSHLLPQETWSAPAPQSVHYLCGPLKTQLHKRLEPDSLLRAERLAHEQIHEQLGDLPSLWPGLGAVTDRAALPGERDRYVRANIDPSECCVGAPAGGVSARLRTDGTRYGNLRLAGAWIRTGLDASCVEGAVMSGMQAARSISGEALPVIGEHFMGEDPDAS